MNYTYTPGDDLTTIFQLPGFVASLLNISYIILLGVGAFLVAFGIFKFIAHADDETERKTGRMMILWGVVGLFLMVSIWGLVWILINTFNLDRSAPPVPQLQVSTQGTIPSVIIS